MARFRKKVGNMRIETDTMGEVKVPVGALYGAQTQRAVQNFPISGYRFGRDFIWALGLIKAVSAEVNWKLGKLDPGLAKWIIMAANEVAEGKHDSHLVVDIYQTGSGTSTNMNANEVIARLAIQLAGGKVGSKHPIHPNDHVNMGQSSNDVFPTAMHLAAVELFTHELISNLEQLGSALGEKANVFKKIVKIGRTHLQDATSVTLGQEFSGYAAQIKKGIRRIKHARISLLELPIGGTAVGTGVNTHPKFAKNVCTILSRRTGHKFREAPNHFEAQAAKDAFVEASGALNTVAVSLKKIAGDVRLMASGPRCGIGELELPAVQPGSSIMPGKVNPVMCESLLQACVKVEGVYTIVTRCAGEGSILELNTMMPLMAYEFLEGTRILANACGAFTRKCIEGIKANREHCESLVKWSLAMATPLAEYIGHDRAAEIAEKASRGGKTILEVALVERVLPEKKLRKVLDPRAMTKQK